MDGTGTDIHTERVAAYETPFGKGFFICRGKIVTRIFLPGLYSGNDPVPEPDGFQKKIAKQLSGAFLGIQPAVSLNILEMDGLSEFFRAVLLEVHRISSGKTQTYSETALKAGHPKAARAVGRVMANNRFPLVIPCHRVVASKDPGGYQGTVEMKLFLLEKERKTCQFAPNVLL